MRERLIGARRTRNMTQMEIADLLEVNHSHYARIERGEANPSASLAARIAVLFPGISEMELLYPERYPDPKPRAEVLA